MTTLLLILSALFFQLPFSFLQHTIRKFKRMEMQNNSFYYAYENGNPSEVNFLTIMIFVSSLFLPLFPFIIGLNINWFIAIILNLVCLFIVTPFVAFIFYPINNIFTDKLLLLITIVCIIVGLTLYSYA
ncbi:hypothetical protein PG279_07490 [Riemerella anatipestifer]|nr:hypothetical protein [Riemerella anatipestifer]